MKRQLKQLKLVSLFFLVISLLTFSCEKNDDDVSVDNQEEGASNSLANEIFRLVNEHRASLDLSPLVLTDAISQSAETHSINMANGTTPFGHDGFSNRVSDLSQELGRSSSSAENVAFGCHSAQSVMNAWLNSPSHRRNIEGNYTDIGIGVSETGGNDCIQYFTQLFLKRS